MKALIALVVLAVAASAQKVLYDATAYYSEVIPKDGYTTYYMDISAVDALAAGTGYLVEFTADATYDVALQRSMKLWVSNSTPDTTATMRYQFFYSDDTCYVAPMTSAFCQAATACRVYFTLSAICLKETCVNSLTTNVYARLMMANKTYLRDVSATAANHVILMENYTTVPFDVAKNELHYFTFQTTTTRNIPLHVTTSVMDDIAVYGSNLYPMPNSSTLSWVQTDSVATQSLAAGTWYMSVGGKNAITSTATYALCVGAGCSPASVPVVSALLLLVAAFLRML